jgi:hypothetical protein
MVDRLIKDDFIRFDVSPMDALTMTRRIRAALGVVSPTIVAAIQEEAIALVVDNAKHLISRMFGPGFCLNAAVRALEESAKEVLGKSHG